MRFGPEVVIVPGLFAMIAFIVWVVVNGWLRRHHARIMADFNARLIDRIGSVKDFSEFLQTEGGARFMNSLTLERGATRAQDGILRAVQAGIVLVTLGIGLASLERYLTARYGAFGGYELFMIAGAIALSLGFGFLISAGVSYRMARALGVLDGNGRHGDRRAAA